MSTTTWTRSRWPCAQRTWLWYLVVPCLLLLPARLLALDVPFLGPEKDFELRLANHAQLKEAIAAELMEQKKTSAVLKQYTSQYKIDRYQADTIRRMLRARGYYDSEITHRRQNDTTIYNIEPGPLYTVSEISIQFPEDLPAPDRQLLSLQAGKPLRAEDVLSGRDTIIEWVYLNLCLYQVDVTYQAKVYHQNHSASVAYTLKPSPQVRFGELSVAGLETVEPDYLRDRLPIHEGECFNRQRVDAARLTLLQTNLVASADAEISEPKDGRVAVHFDLTERSHRTISAGVGYDVDLGPGVTLGWEHRNLLGRAEKLDITTRVNEIGYGVESEFALPHFKRDNQSLLLHADLLRETPDAYETTTGSVGAALARQLNANLFGSLGLNLRYSKVLEDGTEDEFYLFSVPVTLEYDERNDLLNPTAGWRVAVATEPFTDVRDTDLRFTKMQVTANWLHTEFDWPGQPTFAAQVATGTITGVRRRQVPADLRFYVGGGGSVRGYPYQSLGDLTDGEPDGGRSFTEIALETRFRFTQSWGGVIFVDGGYAYAEEMPEFGQDLLWGTGVGVRYLTSFAPIRFDIAVPLDRRDDIDDPFQIYISIGQAF